MKYLGLCLGLSVLLSACVVGADEDLLASDGIDEAEIEDDVPLALAYCWQGGALPCQGSNMSSYDASTKAKATTLCKSWHYDYDFTRPSGYSQFKGTLMSYNTSTKRFICKNSARRYID